MSSFLDYSSSNAIHHLYRPTSSPIVCPRKWWQYAIRVTMMEVRHNEKLDIWKLVSEVNEQLLEQLYEDHPPPAIRMRKELVYLRSEVQSLREENETLRKLLADALEPTIRKACSISTFKSGTGENDVIELQETDGFSGLTSHTHSRIELMNIEDEDQVASDKIGKNMEESTSIITDNYQGLAQNSIESTALTHSPYEKMSNILPSLSPAQGSIVSYLHKLDKERKLNADTTSVTSSKASELRQADLKQARVRSTMIHKDRILKAAEIHMAKAMESIPDVHDDKNSPRFHLRDDKVASPPKLPLDNGLLTREQRLHRAETVYSPRTAMSSSTPRNEPRSVVRDESSRRSRQSRSPGRRSSPSRSAEPHPSKVIYPQPAPDMGYSEKVAVEIIAKVRRKNRANSPDTKKALTSTEINLLRSPFAEPVMRSPREAERDGFKPPKSPRSKHHAAVKKSKVAAQEAPKGSATSS